MFCVDVSEVLFFFCAAHLGCDNRSLPPSAGDGNHRGSGEGTENHSAEEGGVRRARAAVAKAAEANSEAEESNEEDNEA